jgi:hypothetical protein
MGKFQQTFGFDQDMKRAKNQAFKRERRAGGTYGFLTVFTGGLGDFYLVTFLFFKGIDWDFNQFYTNVFALHRCHLYMKIGLNKGKHALDYLQIEIDKNECNHNFHMILSQNLINYSRSLRYRKTNDWEKIHQILLFIEKISGIYKNRRIPPVLLESLTDLVFESALTMESLSKSDFKPLLPAFEVLFHNAKEETLLKLLTSLQVLIENDKTDSIASNLSPDLWALLKSLQTSENRDLSQGSRDILTYFLISSQAIPFPFTLKDVYTLANDH